MEGVEREEEPVSHEQDPDRQDLEARVPPQQQEDEEVPQADLREDRGEAELRLPAPVGSQEDPQQDQHDRTVGRVERLPPRGLPPRPPGGVRERHRHPDHEHEGGLDEIPEGAPLEPLGDLRQPEARRGHQEHGEAAVGVQRDQPAGLRELGGGGRRGRGRGGVQGILARTVPPARKVFKRMEKATRGGQPGRVPGQSRGKECRPVTLFPFSTASTGPGRGAAGPRRRTPLPPPGPTGGIRPTPPPPSPDTEGSTGSKPRGPPPGRPP